MHKQIIIFTLLFFSTFLFSADLNTTLVDANTSTYELLLKKMSNEKNATGDHSLEVMLLHKLIDTQYKKIPDIDLVPVRNSLGYQKLFLSYLDNIYNIISLKKEVKKNTKKMDIIKTEIAHADHSDPQLFSLQLQTAFYQKQVHIYSQQLKHYNERNDRLSPLLIQSIKYIQFDQKSIKEHLQTDLKSMEKYNNEIMKLKIDKDQYGLNRNQKQLHIINQQIQVLQNINLKIKHDVLSEQFLLFSHALHKKSEQAFEIEKKLRKQLIVFGVPKEVYSSVVFMLLKMENEYLGNIATLTDSGEQEFKSLVYSTWEYANRPVFSIGGTEISILKMTISFIILIFGFLIAGMYKKKIDSLTLNKRSFTPSTRTMVGNLGYYVIILIVFFLALNVLGVKLSSLALVAGALSVGIGFGLQNIVSNFVSGLILMFEKSIKIGDYVQLDDENLHGHVVDIRMRATTINTNDNIDIIVPNQNFIQHNVINWTMNDKIRRFEIPFSVKYGTDAEEVIGLIKKAVNQSAFSDIYTTSERYTRVFMTGMGDNSVNFELLVWIKGNDTLFPQRTTSRFLILIYKTLNENHIEIPFPQRDLHIRSVDVPLSFVVKEGDEKA